MSEPTDPAQQDGPLTAEIKARIARHGPVPFSVVMQQALYDDLRGFYATHGRAGRRGDFITSPEVGPLFGAVIARALDHWWDELGRPSPYVVVDAGAGPGTLARAVLAASPRCADALRYVLVERSASQRVAHHEHLSIEPPSSMAMRRRRGPVVTSLAELPNLRFTGVVIANELLDNLAVDLDGAAVGVEEGQLVFTGEPFAPKQAAAQAWLADALDRLALGMVVAIDYTGSDFGSRPWRDWLRTYRGHERGGHPLEQLGSQDITCEVDVDQLAHVHAVSTRATQAAFLRSHGIEELVEDGRRVWTERAHLGDLAALRARSRVREADALLDPSGLGGFEVVEWTVG